MSSRAYERKIRPNARPVTVWFCALYCKIDQALYLIGLFLVQTPFYLNKFPVPLEFELTSFYCTTYFSDPAGDTGHPLALAALHKCDEMECGYTHLAHITGLGCQAAAVVYWHWFWHKSRQLKVCTWLTRQQDAISSKLLRNVLFVYSCKRTQHLCTFWIATYRHTAYPRTFLH